MVELIINGNKIELPKNSSIKYSKQISDIFDIAKVSVSFTNSFGFEKTPQNTQAMQQLGISGDGSNIPYQKNTAQLKVDGFDLVSNGWFNVSNTDENYQGSILDGMVDFFKTIENKTMGLDLDLSNFNHDKNLENIINSWTNEYYRYLIADYGGKNIFNDGINIDYQAPSFSVKELWKLIFKTFGFNCDYNNLSYLDGLYITYPKDVIENQTDDLIATLTKSPYITRKLSFVGSDVEPMDNEYKWTSSLIVEGNLSSDLRTFVIPTTDSYLFDLKIENYLFYRRINYYSRAINPSIYIYKNGVKIGSIISDFLESNTVEDERSLYFNLSCSAGDLITVKIIAPRFLYFRSKQFYAQEWRHNSTVFKISKTNLGTTILQNELKDFSIKDFIKEIIWRTGLTPIYIFETNTVNFETLDSRIDFANAVDLTHTFVKREGEIYTTNYAQKNIFALKKNNDLEQTGDGYLYVQNVNLDDEKNLAQSKLYAPDKKIITDFFGTATNQYKIWEVETKINNDNIVEVNYKGLSGRFYFIRQEQNLGSFKITSEKLVDFQTVSNVPFATNTDTLFEEAVFKNYSEYQKIFNNFRIHNIKQVLTIDGFLKIDMAKPIFFKQENAYYICNKISFEEGKMTTNEFIKINKV